MVKKQVRLKDLKKAAKIKNKTNKYEEWISAGVPIIENYQGSYQISKRLYNLIY